MYTIWAISQREDIMFFFITRLQKFCTTTSYDSLKNVYVNILILFFRSFSYRGKVQKQPSEVFHKKGVLKNFAKFRKTPVPES